MADLSDKNSSDNVKLVGSDTNGAETNYLAVDENQQALVKDAGANSALASIDAKIATSAKQDTGNSSLSSIDSKISTAANQVTANNSLSSIDSKVSTAANQTTANTSLASIDSKLTTITNNQTNQTQSTKIVSSGTEIGRVADALKVSIASDFITASVPTYTASVVGLTTATNPTDVFVLRGSATKKVKIIDMQLSGLQQQTGYVSVEGVKRSSANSGGTALNATIVTHDSTDVSPTASVQYYTANPTSLGTAVGTTYALFAFVPSGNASGGGNIAGVDIVHGIGKPLTLVGANEYFCLNFGGVSIPGLKIIVTITWIEEI